MVLGHIRCSINCQYLFLLLSILFDSMHVLFLCFLEVGPYFHHILSLFFAAAAKTAISHDLSV